MNRRRGIIFRPIGMGNHVHNRIDDREFGLGNHSPYGLHCFDCRAGKLHFQLKRSPPAIWVHVSGFPSRPRKKGNLVNGRHHRQLIGFIGQPLGECLRHSCEASNEFRLEDVDFVRPAIMT